MDLNIEYALIFLKKNTTLAMTVLLKNAHDVRLTWKMFASFAIVCITIVLMKGVLLPGSRSNVHQSQDTGIFTAFDYDYDERFSLDNIKYSWIAVAIFSFSTAALLAW